MALDPTSASPCDLLNATSFPTLFMAPGTSESVAYPRIASRGTPVRYVDSLAGVTMTGAILASSEPTSKFRLVQFLSGASVASMSSVSSMGSTVSSPGGDGPVSAGAQVYSTLGAVVLRTQSGQYEGIIDNYIAPFSANYAKPTFTASRSSFLTDSQFWTPSDIVNGVPVSSPISVLGKLIKAGHLLSEAQVYTPSQLAADATQPSVGSESLIYLYNLAQKTKLSPAQQGLQSTLEATNLRFFGAFMAEYCFYRTRYDWLLTKFFSVYSIPTIGAGAYTTSLSTTASPALSASVSLSQPEYINGLMYQMACLNTRLSDMRTLLSKINAYYNGVFTEIQTNINSSTAVGSNKKLTETITALQTSATKANTYLAETDFAQEAMNYNSEKNRYSNILLGLYAFLNIAALATVFQLARS